MTDMSKITSEDIEQAEENLKTAPPVKQDTAKEVLLKEFGFEIKLPSMGTPFYMVTGGLIVMIIAGGENAFAELIVGGSLSALGGLLEFVDRRLLTRRKTRR